MNFLETWGEDRRKVHTENALRFRELCDSLYERFGPHPINQRIQIRYWCPCLRQSDHCDFLPKPRGLGWEIVSEEEAMWDIAECYPARKVSWLEKWGAGHRNFHNFVAPYFYIIELRLSDDSLFEKIQDYLIVDGKDSQPEYRDLLYFSSHVHTDGMVYCLRHRHHQKVTKIATSGGRHAPDVEFVDIRSSQGFAEIGPTSVQESFEALLNKKTFPIKVWHVADDLEIILAPHRSRAVVQYIKDYMEQS